MGGYGQAQLLSWTWSQGSLDSEPLPTLLFVLWPLSVELARNKPGLDA